MRLSKLILWSLLIFFSSSCATTEQEENIDSTESEITIETRFDSGVDIDAINIAVDSIIPWDIKTSCLLRFSKSNDAVPGKIKCRGGISSKYWKHSFSLSLKKDTALIKDITPDNDYIVNANYVDKTFIRHKLSYDIFRLMDSENISPKCGFKHLYINNTYEGLYVLMEKVDKSLINSSLKKNSKTDTLQLLIKDGGLFIENHDDFHIQADAGLYHQKYPKQQTENQLTELSELWTFLFNSSDIDFSKNVSSYFDIDNIVNWHLLLLITNNGDGVVKNFYWYKTSDGLWRVIPWDYDDSFGRNGDYSIQTTESEWERNVLLSRLFNLNIDNYRYQLKSKWQTFSSTVLSLEQIDALITKNEKDLLEIGVDLNFKKWPITSDNYLDSNNFEQEIQIVRDYFDLRYPKIDSIIATWETL